MAATRKRKVLVWLTLFVGLLLVLIAALPLWFPWIFPQIARHYSLHYSAYERQGYARFILRDATLTNRNVHFQSARIETYVPTAYLWQRYFGQAPTFLQISNWSLELQPSSAVKSPKPPYSQFQDLQTNLARVLAFVPKAVLIDGRIEDSDQTIAIPGAIVSTGTVSAQMAFPKYRQDATLVANLQPQPVVRVDSDTLNLHATLKITHDPAALRFETTGIWLTNQFRAGAQFSPKVLLPDKAYVDAKDFSIPSQFLSFPQFTDFHGSLSGEWLTNRFYLDVNGSAEPRVPQNLPPLTLNLRGTGDTNTLFIDQAKLSAPGMDAQLSEKTKIQFTPPFLTKPTEFSFNLDLNRQPWFSARGQLRGDATVLPSGGKYPQAQFTLAGSGIQISNIQTKALSVTGALQWPSLQISNAAVAFEDNSVLNGQADVDLLKREVQNGLTSLNGRIIQQWLPSGYSLTNTALSLQFAGPYTNLSHTGQLDLQGLTRTAPGNPQKPLAIQILPRPLNLQAKWRGQQLTIQDLQAQISAGNSTLALQGSANLATPEKSLRLTTLDLRRTGKPLLTLQQPTQFTFQFLNNTTWRTLLTRFDWSGPGGQIHLTGQVDWPQRGTASALLDGLDVLDFEDFLQLPAQRLFVNNFTLAANWLNGPLQYRLMFSGEGALRDKPPFEVQGSLSGSEEGLSLTNLAIFSQSNLLTKANGALPITIHPGLLAIKVLPDAPLRVDAQTEPGALLWNELATLTGVQLENPHFKLQATGTWKAPRADLQFQASKAQLPKSKEPLPDLEDIKATVHITADSARLDALTLSVAEQPVSITAETPLTEKFWLSLLNQPQLPDLSQASARLKISQAEVAAMTQLLPKFLHPQGILKADVSLLPGGNLDGQLSINGAATAPLPNLGPVSGLELVARFQQRTMNLKAGGIIGGGLVSVNGALDLRGDPRALLDRWQKGLFPPFQLRVQGTNVSLVRQPELIVRADLDATLSQAPNQPVMLAGTVQLHDSLYLEDVSNLIEGKAATPGSRPPYFSVSTEPFAQWQIDLKITGSKFMRVQTPVFRGTLSSNLKLSGTLKDPVALGDLTIDSGDVQFPFASLPVTQGFISLTSADPYRPHLFINGAGQALGYDIHMEITGPADKLALQFSSTPALSSQQILLMLTTGELPRGSYSLSTQQRAQTFALFLGRNVLTQFGFGSGTANRLTIRSGEEFTETGRPTYSVEYKLAPRWSVIGQYDRFNEYNLMLKWKAYSR